MLPRKDVYRTNPGLPHRSPNSVIAGDGPTDCCHSEGQTWSNDYHPLHDGIQTMDLGVMMYVSTFLRLAQGIVLAKGCLPHNPRIASPKPQLHSSHSLVTSWKESLVQVLTRPNVAWLRGSDENRYFQHCKTADVQTLPLHVPRRLRLRNSNGSYCAVNIAGDAIKNYGCYMFNWRYKRIIWIEMHTHDLKFCVSVY